MNFSKVAVLGPGLLGGSIAMALRERRPETQVTLWARREEAAAAAKCYAHDATTDLKAAVENAALIILCVPIGAMKSLAEKFFDQVASGSLVTDVGSVKTSVVAQLEPMFVRGGFMGSHPMAGSEQAGIAAARADLFQNAACMITPTAASAPEAVVRLRSFWEMLGCRVQTLAPEEHDALVAAVSHLPHLLAATLVQLAAGENPQALDLSGPGFRDTTRIASGPPAMWAEILHENRGPLQKSAQALIEKLRGVLKLLDAGDLRGTERFLTDAKTSRDALRAKQTR